MLFLIGNSNNYFFLIPIMYRACFCFLRTQSAEGTTGKEYRAYQSPSRKVW